MEGVLKAAIEKITDPFMLFSLVVILGLFYLLNQKEKKTGASIAEMFRMIGNSSESISENTAALVRLSTLVETLVFRNGGSK